MSAAPADRAPLRFDPADPATIADPFPIFARLQDEDPVHYAEPLGGWMVTRYADVVTALRNLHLSSDRVSPFFRDLPPEQREEMRELEQSLGSWAVFSDPPKHTRLRNLFIKAFTMRTVEALRAEIGKLVDELLNRALRADEFDFIAEFAYPLPALVICEILGLPREDIDRIRAWSDDVAMFIGPPRKTPGSYAAALRSHHALSEYFRAQIAERHTRPHDDLIARLLAVRDADDQLSEDELVSTCALLLFAAHTTTTHLLGNGLLALSRHPEQLTALREDPAGVVTAVEELLRYDGPIQSVRRIATQPIEIAGRTIGEGEIVFMLLNAANRDARVFHEPHRLDLQRGENHHIAFGYGMHFCAGAPLAKLEAQIALPVLLDRLGSFEPVDLEWLGAFGFRGLQQMRIRHTSR